VHVRALTRDDLVASHFTLAGAMFPEPPRFSFEDRAAAAGRAGFAGIGLMIDEYAAERAAGLSDADLRSILDDHGVVLAEIEFVFDWSAGPEEPERVAHARRLQDGAWAMADAFGPRVLSMGEIVGPEALPPIDVLAERFAAVCDRAAEHDLLVALEFIVATGISDAATAGAVVRAADRSNGGINADSWHHFRGAADDAALAAVADRVFMVQLDDADAERAGEPFVETVTRRRYPGDGTFDLRGFIRLLDDGGAQGPLSVEVMSPEHHALPVEEAARRAFASTRAVVTAARS
jgi:sugar phosphate isomerase/epimerase